MRRSLLVVLLLLPTFVLAQKPTSPKQGSPERKALMDALRGPVEKSLKQKVIFQVDNLKVLKGWAFMTGKPRAPSGKAINYSKTAYKEAINAGAFDDWVCALWKKKGTKWQLVKYAIGATDVVWEPWPKDFGAPKAIFPFGT